MRVGLVSRAFPPAVGGMERFAEALADWLAARGHGVVVATRTGAAEGEDSNRAYQVVRGTRSMEMFRTLRGVDVFHVNGLSLRAIATSALTRRRPVVTHQGHQAICPTGLAWATGEPCTAGDGRGPCANCPGGGRRGRAEVLAHRAGAALARANVPVSNYLADRLRVPRSRVIYNPVTAQVFAAASPDKGADGLVAFAGRLVVEKGLDRLLRALTHIPEGRLEVGGDGPMLRDWERLTDDLGLRRRVRFLGALTFQGIAALYRRASVVCVPTVCEEAFGYAAAEAMAMGRPVVATPRGALPELLSPGRGFVAGDTSPRALADALETAMTDLEAGEAAGERARRFALERLSIDAVGPRYEDLYLESVSGVGAS